MSQDGSKRFKKAGVTELTLCQLVAPPPVATPPSYGSAGPALLVFLGGRPSLGIPKASSGLRATKKTSRGWHLLNSCLLMCSSANACMQTDAAPHACTPATAAARAPLRGRRTLMPRLQGTPYMCIRPLKESRSSNMAIVRVHTQAIHPGKPGIPALNCL